MAGLNGSPRSEPAGATTLRSAAVITTPDKSMGKVKMKIGRISFLLGRAILMASGSKRKRAGGPRTFTTRGPDNI
jgi:hypothetical protein